MLDISERYLFSIYGVTVEYPKAWKIFFDPKKQFDFTHGFFRLEKYQPKVGAEFSMGLNWEKAPSTNEKFPRNYLTNLERGYKKQLGKNQHKIEQMDIIDFRGGKAAFIISEYQGGLGIMPLTKRMKLVDVRSMQLAFYDEDSGRAIVNSMLGFTEHFKEEEEALRELVFTVRAEEGLRYYPNAVDLSGEAAEAEAEGEPAED